MQNKYRKYIKLFLLVIAFSESIVFSYPKMALAASNGGVLTDQICTPDQGNSSTTFTTNSNSSNSTANTNITKCIHNIYLFSISFAAVISVFFLVIAGYRYMTGSDSQVKKAKETINRVIIAMVLLLGAFIFLNTINPDLVKIPNLGVTPVDCSIFGQDQTNAPSCTQLTPDDLSNTGVSANAANLKPYNNSACSQCVDITSGGLTAKDGHYLNTALTQALMNAHSIYPNFQVTEAYPPVVDHQSSCHQNGTCADLGLTTSNKLDPNAIKSLCTALKRSGISIVNEYYMINAAVFEGSDCPLPQRFSTTTGGDLHVHLP